MLLGNMVGFDISVNPLGGLLSVGVSVDSKPLGSIGREPWKGRRRRFDPVSGHHLKLTTYDRWSKSLQLLETFGIGVAHCLVYDRSKRVNGPPQRERWTGKNGAA